MTRSFTVPPKLTVSTRNTSNPEIGAADGIETLYVHPSASIIKFNTGASRPSSSSGSPLVRHGENSGTLPWSYPTESTLAVGPMEIYRVPGSVSFLHSGALLHAILPRSQCWCVDGVSKFAFRVLPETYYRIELPGETAEDLELVEALKLTFKKVLFYERTACPFARGFTVDLPVVEEVKVKKRNSVREGPAKKWKLQKAYSWKPEGWEEEEPRRQTTTSESQPGSGDRSEASDGQEDEEEDGPSDELREEGDQEDDSTAGITNLKLRPRPLESMRSVTAPSQMQAQSITPSRVRSRVQAVENVDRAHKAEKVRFSVEIERRSSVRAKRPSTAHVALPPSPPDSSAVPELLTSDEVSIPEEEEAEIQTNDVSEEEEANDLETPSTELGLEETVLPPKSDEHAIVEDEPSTGIDAEELSTRSNSLPRTPPGEIEQPERESRDEIVQYDEDSLPRELAEISLSDDQQHETVRSEPNPPTAAMPASEDPYAAIQARIQARRSIGGTTTSFHPASKSPTRKENPSTASSVSLASQRSNKSGRAQVQRHHSITATLVNKAFAVFLGPPAHLVTMMLRIAARFSSGAFGSHSMFFVESPIGSPRRVPGSFYLEDEEDRGWKSEEEEEEVEEWDEDDFGVPLRSPVRISGMRERARRDGWEME
jgi:hypothetical protein